MSGVDRQPAHRRVRAGGVIAAIAVPLLAAAAPPAGHWSLLPPERSPPPCVERRDVLNNEVDAHIELALQEHGLSLAPEAPREALVRRLAFDLTGLPPAPDETAAFVADDSPDAYERVVDRLLASPRHGERWGQHWLDAAGYADSNGHFSADTDRPLAYKYRDWVIRAHNADKPFDRFVAEQVAGDELAGFEPDGDVTAEAIELLAATHYLRNSQDGTGESDGNPLEVLNDKLAVIDGAVQIVGSSLLGMTLQCARCHDHKFDPITQADYYALHAVLAPAYSTRRWRKPAERVVRAGTRAERAAFDAAAAAVDRDIAAWKSSLEAALEPLSRLVALEKARGAAGLDVGEREALEKAIDTAPGKRTKEQNAIIKRHGKLVEVAGAELDGRFAELRALRDAIKTAVERLERSRPPPLEHVSALFDVDIELPAQRILLRGSATEPGPEVLPGVPAALLPEGELFAAIPPPPPARSSGRRTALARWLVSARNPLVPRVLVNRVWQHHFGAGLVATPDNFGTTGAPPTHPRLLDALAVELVESGWSLKSLHRRLVLSATYRQSSRPAAAGLARDPDNRLWWRFAPRRLDAESVRDAHLFAAGRLDGRIGGPPVPVEQAPDGQFFVREDRPGAFRRSVYLERRRTRPVTLLEVFDAPLIVASCTRRTTSTTALQSLALLNSEFSLARAADLAARVARESGAGAPGRVDLTFRLALGRPPGPEERMESLAFLAAASPPADRDFAQALLASNACLYLD